jgi:uncharacterized protein Yka (UPF0111/DUF47 family)
MAGRPRIYANAAEKTRAYRERLRKHTSEFEEWAEQATDAMRYLRRSVIIAQRRGDVLALSLRTEDPIDLMKDLTSYFDPEAAAPQKQK